MAIEYNCSFGPLECYPTSSEHTDVVFLVHYQMVAITGSDEMGYYQARVINQIPLTVTTSSVFIPYQDLTYNVVKGWVEAAMGPEQVAALYEGVTSDLENQINPRSVPLPPPWES